MRIAEVAREQAGVFSRGQAAAAGVSSRRLETLCRQGVLRRSGKAYAATTTPDGLEHRLWETALALGGPLAFTGLAAAAVHGFPSAPPPARLRVLVPASRRPPRQPGVSATRCDGADLAGARVVRGLPVTSVAVTLRECAREVPDATLLVLVRDELRRRTVTLAALYEVCGRGRAGSAALSRALRACGDRAESHAEQVLLRALRRRGLRPVTQHPVGRYRLDFHWPDALVAVEVDGDAHLDPVRHAYDRRRDNELAVGHGITTLRFPADAVLRDPEGTAREVAAALRRVTCRRRRRRRTSSP